MIVGVMATGLSGEYCWDVSLRQGTSVRIEQAEIPTENIPVPVQ